MARTRDRDRRGGKSRDWQAEYAALSARDRQRALGPADLERLGMAAYCAGDEPATLEALTRAHILALDRADTRQAARAARDVALPASDEVTS